MSNDERHRSSAEAGGLDDELDRSEIRNRYYGLLQELRVVVTGVQVLLAFLLTVPFAQGFAQLDGAQRAWFGGALVSATLSVIAFVTPTAMHRYGKRTARGDRLAFSIAATRIGLFFLALAVLLSFGVVVDHLYAGSTPVVLTVGVSAALLVAWFVVPVLTHLIDGDVSDSAREPSGPARGGGR
jgi:hypothetical protein